MWVSLTIISLILAGFFIFALYERNKQLLREVRKLRQRNAKLHRLLTVADEDWVRIKA